MVLKNLNDVSIYIVPLYDDKITWRDLTVESGFINAFTTDKNRPYLEDKIFLVYDSSVNTKEALDRFLKFSKLDSFYGLKYMNINRKNYTVYCLSNPKYAKDIKRLQRVGKVYSSDAMMTIAKFWNGIPVPELTNRVFVNTYRYGEAISAEVPEEDYYSYKEW